MLDVLGSDVTNRVYNIAVEIKRHEDSGYRP